MATQTGQLLMKLEEMLKQGKEKDELIYKILTQQEQQNQAFRQILSQMEPMIGRIVSKVAESAGELHMDRRGREPEEEGAGRGRRDAEAGLAETFRAAEEASRERRAAAMTKAPDKRGIVPGDHDIQPCGGVAGR